MTLLLGRSFSLTIGAPNNPALAATVAFNDQNATGFDISGLDCEFNIEKTLKAEPNTLSLQVYNLSESTRRLFEGSQKLTVQLEAGYQGETALLWLGEARAAWSTREGPDIITHIESGDGEKEHRTSRIQLCYGPKIPVSVALTNLATAMGVGLGNTVATAQVLQASGVNTFNGVLSGSASRRLTDFCRSVGYEWSIQNGALQFVKIGALVNQASNGPNGFLLSSDTGMIGSPTVDNNGIVTTEVLITPGIIPGSLVSLQGEFLQGSYRVQRCRYQGQTWGNSWSIGLEMKRYTGTV
jgi:hypothetical protein